MKGINNDLGQKRVGALRGAAAQKGYDTMHPKIQPLMEQLNSALVGKEEVTRLAVIALLARGHLLIEDVPGVGKTTLALALAKSLDLSFGRIQFTPDTLPGDVTGYSTLDMRSGELKFNEGPVLHNIVLADEINRTSPKTQAALLEVMGEGQVTVEGRSIPTPEPFMVIATENPIEFVGTYNLPEAQLDRFMMQISVGYPKEEGEVARLQRMAGEKKALSSQLSREELLEIQQDVSQVKVDESIQKYIVALVSATRDTDQLSLGASPRAAIALMEAARAAAYLDGRDYVKPEDVRDLAVPVLAHRLVLSLDASLHKATAESVLGDCLKSVPLPPVFH